jgi:hypothetical protein
VDPTAPRTPTPPARPFRLTLGEMMLWIALIAVCLWAATTSTILGVLAAVTLAPILGRASRIVRRRMALGRPVDASTWAIAVLGSVGPVGGTWLLAVVAYLGGCWAVMFLGACLVAIFPDIVVASIGVLAACAAFYISAIHSWAIREHEVGRVPGSARDSDAAEENPANATFP